MPLYSRTFPYELKRPLNIHKRLVNEKDFIEYLNKKVCTEEKCVYVESIGLDYKRKKWPEKTENVIGIISK